MRSVESVLADNVPLAGAAASDLPWWTPIAVSAVLLAIALVYVIRHRTRGTPGEGAAESLDDAPFAPTRHDMDEPDRPTPGFDTRALVRDGSGT